MLYFFSKDKQPCSFLTKQTIVYTILYFFKHQSMYILPCQYNKISPVLCNGCIVPPCVDIII